MFRRKVWVLFSPVIMHKILFCVCQRSDDIACHNKLTKTDAENVDDNVDESDAEDDADDIRDI